MDSVMTDKPDWEKTLSSARSGFRRCWSRHKWDGRFVVTLLVIVSAFAFAFILQVNLLRQSMVHSQMTDSCTSENRDSCLKKIFDHRLELMGEICAKYSNPLRGESLGLLSLPIDEARFYSTMFPKFAICMIPKVASTSLATFIVNAHQSSNKKNFGLENLSKPIPFVPHLNSSYRALVVRHPLERLLSAFIYIFRTEIERDPPGIGLFSILSRQLVMTYRNVSFPPEQTREEKNLLTFPEYIRYILRGSVDFSKESDPTVRDDNLNGHWLPYWKLCSPCRNESRPHIIIKIGKDITEEMKYMVKESGLHQLINDEDQFLWLNPSIKQGENSNSKGSQYYSQLDRETILELYHRFRIDHEMFDYSIMPYLSYAQSKVEL